MANTKWSNFLKELSKLYFFWCFGVLFFLLFRVLFILSFKEQLSDSFSSIAIAKTLFMGFRFDSTVVAYFLIIPLLVLFVFSGLNKFKTIRITRNVFQYLFAILSSCICMVTLNYFGEYHNQFNNFLFLALYDDQKAVLNTIIEDFNPLLNIGLLAFVITLGILVLRFFEKKNFIYKKLNRITFKGSAFLIVFVSCLLLFGSIRGSFTAVPAIRKHAGVTKDAFLNKTILNPFRALKYALKDFKSLNLINGENPYLNETEFANLYNKHLVTDYLKKKAKGTEFNKPKQVFLIVMESYDSWPLMGKYLPFKLSANLNEIAQNGTHFNQFLPASNSTFNSFGSIVTNVPYCGINIGNIGAINEPYKTSIFKQFKKLGYKANLFYGGFLSWQNIGEFATYQGVENIVSGADAGGESDSGSWGVADEKLFDLVLERTKPSSYSLNVILTSSYHAPYVIDVYSKGFPYKSVDDLPKEMKKYFDNGMTLEEMGHLWYSDKAIGDFVKKAKEKYPDAIFCFTGDHYGRRFINHKPNLYERNSVGFILYGNNIPKGLNKTPGSHIDIMPTLIELVAPKGFEYYSFGTSMFSSSKTTGIGYNNAVDTNTLYNFPKDQNIEKITLPNMVESQISDSPLIPTYKKQMALAWYYTMKGDSLFTK
ncbi:MAG: LTA synthase family protein [Cellulophaga sp.]